MATQGGPRPLRLGQPSLAWQGHEEEGEGEKWKKRRKKKLQKTWVGVQLLRRGARVSIACQAARVGMRIRRCGHGFALALHGQVPACLFRDEDSKVWVRIIFLVARDFRAGLPREQFFLFSGFHIAHCSSWFLVRRRLVSMVHTV